MSWSTISREELDNTIPVSPPVVNRIIKPIVQSKEGGKLNIILPDNVLSHLKTLTPVGIAIIIVADVK